MSVFCISLFNESAAQSSARPSKHAYESTSKTKSEESNLVAIQRGMVCSATGSDSGSDLLTYDINRQHQEWSSFGISRLIKGVTRFLDFVLGADLQDPIRWIG